MSDRAYMRPVWYRLCWIVMFVLDRLPGYCRYYVLRRPAADGTIRQLHERHWGWHRHAMWGFRLLSRVGAISAWIAECERRSAERRNPSSRS